MVAHALKDGYLDLSEDQVQLALEQILNVPFHKKDWGGEYNDLYAEVIVNGSPTATASLLKGNGPRRAMMRDDATGAVASVAAPAARTAGRSCIRRVPAAAPDSRIPRKVLPRCCRRRRNEIYDEQA